MKSELYVFLTHDADAPLTFAKSTARGEASFGVIAPGEAAPGAARAERVIAVAPGEDVAVLNAAVPARSERQAALAARFAIEDEVAQPLDSLHVVLGPRRPGTTQRLVAAIDAQRWALWRERLATTGLEVEAAAPDFLLLPVEAGEALALDLGDRVLARAGSAGFAVDAAFAPEVLAAFVARAAPTRLSVRSDRIDALIAKCDLAGIEVVHGRAATAEETLDALRAGAAGEFAIDLTADQAANAAGPWLDAKMWRRAAALAAVALAGYIGVLFAETRILKAQADRAYDRAAAIVTETFPDITRVVNPRAQMRERVGGLGGAGSLAFLDLSALVADSLADIDTLEVEALRFDDARAELAVSIVYERYEDVESFRAALQARGGTLEEGGSRQRGAVMSSDVVVRAAP